MDLVKLLSNQDDNIKRENANINADAPMGIMLKVGSETVKELSLNKFIAPEIAQLHRNGDIHIHDLDFYPITFNCCQINLNYLLEHGFHTGHGYIRSPSNILTASYLTCIALQSNQNDMYGGQSIPTFEYDLAPYVAKSFIKHLIMLVKFDNERTGEDDERLYDAHKKLFNKYLEYKTVNCDEFRKYLEPFGVDDGIFKTALKLTERDTYQAMEALIHNLNTMQSRAGAQTPFSSINYGTGTTWEQRLVIKAVLNATDAGLGNHETPIFPVQVFKVKDGINTKEGDPNYDLLQLACKVTAKRLFPNFSFLDATYNIDKYKPGKPETELAVMGCRTRVFENHVGDEIVTGRGNLSFTTINLPRLAIEYKDDFYAALCLLMCKVEKQLLNRFELIAKKKVYNFPFLMGQGVWLDSEKLSPDDEIREVLKHGSMSIGFIGLAECLTVLTGKHHGESEEAQKMGLEIIGFMRSITNNMSLKTGLNFSLFATPAEGLCLVGDTLVQTNLGNIPIKDIKEGTLVLTFNEVTREKEFKKVLKSGMTFSSASVMKISFDDGSSIVCTPNHPFMVRVGMYRDDEKSQFCSVNGTNEVLDWYRADELKVGMRIKSDEIFIKNTGHLKLRNGKTIHRMVWEYYNGKIPEGYVIHHKDENKLNNSIDNLQLLTRKEHKILHMKDTILSHCYTHESVLGEKNPFFGKIHSKKSKDKISFTKRLANNKKKLSDAHLIELFYSGKTCEEIAAQFKAKPDVIKHRLFNELNIPSEKNHIITSIEYLKEEQPVYDLTVEDNHNFFVGGNRGILVHNSGRFVKLDREKYGIIDGVTDREYYTNSFHVPVWYEISAYKKLAIEAPYHELCNAGSISYIELNGNCMKNISALQDIVLYMKSLNMNYCSINHPVDRCPVCGYQGIINDTCPKCGRHEGEGVSVEKLKALGVCCGE